MPNYEAVFESKKEAVDAYINDLTISIKELALSATELDQPLISQRSKASKILSSLISLRELGIDGISVPFARSIDDPDNPPGNVNIMIWGDFNIFAEISYPKYALSAFGQFWNHSLGKTQLSKPKNIGDK